MSDDAEGFLARWSRRKREPEPEPPVPAEPEVLPVAKAACPIPNLPEIDLASLPRIEDLTAESDFSGFLRPGIPAALRGAALRRMWSLDPAIRDFIGSVEYQWDFNAPGGLPLGFANELLGDVKQLLAQAIGELGNEKKTPPETAPPEEVAPGPLEPDEPPAEMVMEAEAPATEPEPAGLPRRRHGGALPA